VLKLGYTASALEAEQQALDRVVIGTRSNVEGDHPDDRTTTLIVGVR